MQKLPKFQHSRVSLFASLSDQSLRCTTRTIALIGLVFGAVTTSSAQITPSGGGTPGAGVPTTGRPGQAAPSGNVQLPAGVQVPANIPAGTQLPNGMRVGPNGTIQQGQAPGRNTQTGRTTQQGANTNPNQGNAGRTQAGDGQTGQNGQGAVDANGQPIPGDVPLNANEEGAEKTADVLSDQEAARAQERATTRRKLFGYELFNNPTLATTFQPNINIATPVNYVLGTNDQLDINIYGYSQDAIKQTVTPEGNIYLPSGIGPVHVAGLTIDAAKARISERLSKIYVGLKNSSFGPKNTYLEVTLGNIRSIRVSVLGEAVKPGTYTVSSLSSAMNVIYSSGGPSDLGSFRNIQLIRGNRVIATIDLYDLLLSGVLRNNVRLQDNDNIRIPSYLSHVELQGTTRRNNIFELMPNETLDKLLFYGGGFAANAYKSRIKVTRLTNRELKVIDVLADQYKSFVLQDGDVAAVEQVLNRYENQVTISGAVYRPGVYSLDQNKTLKELVTSAEGPRGEALMGRVNIVRTREDMTTENITVDLTKILNGTDADLPLQREDQIVVNSKFDLAEFGDINIQGEVNKPGNIGYVSNMTLEDALVKVGGLRESAALSQIEVVRRKKDVDPTSTSGQIAEVLKFSIDRNLELSNESKFYLQPYDQVVVRRSPNYQIQTYAQVEGEVITPGRYPIRTKDQKLSDLVVVSGGLTPQAYIKGATLVRRVKLSPEELDQRQRSVTELADDLNRRSAVEVEAVVTDKQESIGINLEKIMQNPGSSEDILIQEDDILRIPKKLETVRIQGEVLLPTTVKYRPGQSFQDYISQAGGFTERSQRKRSFVVYANGSVDRTRRFMFFNVYPRVEPGAEVIIPVQKTTPITPQQIIGTVSGIASGLLGLISTLLAISVISGR
ncbi:polysaccharide biosynthesis/export family protein [Fibrivirga algicola]|uniref:Ligand-binding protein n=1 Tax=Fibrivirga algicola TaxID=2950420 RepID=A0ABX0QR83_9BACT|nr:SLBB domain-containing protein [Fibrivirga algicola]ARK11453.1 ligand-binding protein [Fibrella sp. ES10-3-2-2]NID12689.1 ligand-binding protein [Fibrivirga algicola]